jgi:hypothetical protein
MVPGRRRILDLSAGSAPGRSVTVVPNALPVELLDVRATDANGAELVTLQVDVAIPEDLANASGNQNRFWPAGTVSWQWGVFGATHTATADLTRGFAVTLAADFLRARASLTPPPFRVSSEFGNVNDGPAYQVNASLCYGTKPGASGSLRRTQFFDSLPDGGTTPRRPIPLWSRAACVLVPGSVTPGVDLVWYGPSSTGTPIAYSANVGGANSEGFAVVIPLGASSYELRNNSGTELASPAVVWLLAL